MQLPTEVPRQRSRFYDGGDPGDDGGVGFEPPNPGAELEVKLDRQLDDGKEVFVLSRRIAYDDRRVGEIVVPPVYTDFTTDLTSVPRLFTWLVPKTGAHLPAALVHDGLVWDPRQEDQTYISTDGVSIGRVEADRIFRDGMLDTGTGVVRRWLVWTAVTLATIWERDGTSPRAWVRWYYAAVMVVTLLSIGWLGYLATADLFDRSDHWWFAYEVKWMGERDFWVELATGSAGAVVIPLLLSVLWAKFWRAGAIAGVGVGLLFHVSLALAGMSTLLAVMEWLARARNSLLTLFLGAAVTAALVVFVISLA